MFKPGDKVRRIDYDWHVVKVGDVNIVEEQTSPTSMTLVGKSGAYTPKCFELVVAASEVGAGGLTPRKHAATIKAWADGAEIEWRVDADHPWENARHPYWISTAEYRIKPTPKPDVVQYFRALQAPCRMNMDMAMADGLVSWCSVSRSGTDNVQVTFDGETGKLKSVEIVESVV